MAEPGQAVRYELVHALLQRSVKDLSDIRARSGVRIRFLPRQTLIDIFSHDKVAELLGVIAEQWELQDGMSLREMVSHIASEPGTCRTCQNPCTGARAILAALLLAGQETHIIPLLDSSAEPRVCDQDLPFRETTRCYMLGPKDDKSTTDHREVSMSREIRMLQIGTNILTNLGDSERELVLHWQWHVMSPYITTLGPEPPERDSEEQPHQDYDVISLPWKSVEEVRYRREGEVAYVQKLEIYPGNHNLVR